MEWGGVGLLPFLPCKKTGGHALKALFLTEGFPIHHLTVENSPTIAAEDLGCGHVQAKSQKQCSPSKGVRRTGKRKKTSLTSPFLSMPAHCSRRTDHKKRCAHQFCSERLQQMTRSIDRPPERKPRTINLLERLSQYVSVHC